MYNEIQQPKKYNLFKKQQPQNNIPICSLKWR